MPEVVQVVGVGTVRRTCDVKLGDLTDLRGEGVTDGVSQRKALRGPRSAGGGNEGCAA